MTTDEGRAAASTLTQRPQRFAPCFGRQEARAQSLVYRNGLLLAQGRKRAEPMALAFGTPGDDGLDQHQVLALQRFLPHAPWQATAVQTEIQAVGAGQLVPATAHGSIGTVGVCDDSGFAKKGTRSVGVARPYGGRLGKTDHCPVGVFLVGVTPAGTAALDQHLDLPKTWATARRRRKKTRVPKDLRFRTKPPIAVARWDRVRAAGHGTFAWVTADEGSGQNGTFLAALEARQQRSGVEVPVHTTVWTVDPATCLPPATGCGRPPSRPRRAAVRPVREVVAGLPAGAWQAWHVRAGATGLLVFEFARVRVWAVRHRPPGPARWLRVRRSLDAEPEVKYSLSNASADTALGPLALVTGTRYRVEEFFEEGTSYLGLAHDEARAWTSWHQHLSLVALAQLFVTLTRQCLKKSPAPDAGQGDPVAAERLAAIDAYRRRRDHEQEVPAGSQRNRTAVAR